MKISLKEKLEEQIKNCINKPAYLCGIFGKYELINFESVIKTILKNIGHSEEISNVKYSLGSNCLFIRFSNGNQMEILRYTDKDITKFRSATLWRSFNTVIFDDWFFKNTFNGEIMNINKTDISYRELYICENDLTTYQNFDTILRQEIRNCITKRNYKCGLISDCCPSIPSLIRDITVEWYDNQNVDVFKTVNDNGNRVELLNGSCIDIYGKEFIHPSFENVLRGKNFDSLIIDKDVYDTYIRNKIYLIHPIYKQCYICVDETRRNIESFLNSIDKTEGQKMREELYTIIKGQKVTNRLELNDCFEKVVETVDGQDIIKKKLIRRPELIKKSDVEWVDMFEIKGEIKYNKDLYFRFNISENETVEALEQIYRADLNEYHVFTDKVVETVNDEENNKKVEEEYHTLMTRWIDKFLSENEDAAKWCKLHNVELNEDNFDDVIAEMINIDCSHISYPIIAPDRKSAFITIGGEKIKIDLD